jgi:hypothetical protein
MFEKATRSKLRFPYKGQCSVEDLWDIPVKELDNIFKGLNKQIQEVSGESLLDTRTTEDDILKLKIDIIRHIVSVKLEEAASRKTAKERAEKKQKIMEILAAKQDNALQEKSPEELQKMLDEL